MSSNNNNNGPLAPLEFVASPDCLFLTPRPVDEKRNLRHKLSRVDSFVVNHTIGEGISGKVKHALVGDDEVALKVMKKEVAGFSRVQKEVTLQVKCHDHPNIVTCRDFMQSKERLFVAMDLAKCDLFDFICKRSTPLEESRVQRLTQQLVSAVVHMHNNDVCHRDIKPENILVYSDSTIGLTDFGYAMQWNQKCELATSPAGTVRCLPPEAFTKNRECGTRLYDPQKLDMWSVGVVLFFLLTGRFPFDCDSDIDTAKAIVCFHFTTPLPYDISSDARDLVERLLAPENKRLTAEATLNHPFLREFTPSHSM